MEPSNHQSESVKPQASNGHIVSEDLPLEKVPISGNKEDYISPGEAFLPEAPRFSPFRLLFLLNTDALPIVSDPEVKKEVHQQAIQWSERINGHRLLRQEISQIILLRNIAARTKAEREVELLREKQKLLLQIYAAEEEDTSGRKKVKKYTNEAQREAALVVKIRESTHLRSLDDQIFNLKLEVSGYDAQKEALEHECRAVEEELKASRDTMSFLVNTNLVVARTREQIDGQG